MAWTRHQVQALRFKSWGQNDHKNWQVANAKKGQPVRNQELGPAELGIPWVEWEWEGRLGGGAPVGEEGRELRGQAAKRIRWQLPMPESLYPSACGSQARRGEAKIKLSEFPDLLKPGRCTIEVKTVGFRQMRLLFPILKSSRLLQRMLNEYLLSPRSSDGVPEPPEEPSSGS